MYKVIATDLDGTLLRSDKTVSQETVKCLEKLSEKGIIWIPATGRSQYELPDSIKDVSFLSYIMACNGGVIYDCKNRKTIYEKTISFELYAQILDFIHDKRMHPSCVVDGRRAVLSDEDGVIPPEIDKLSIKGIRENTKGYADMLAFVRNSGHQVQKMLIYVLEPELRDTYMKELSEHFPQLAISTSGKYNIEVNAQGINKGTGLLALCNVLNICVEDTIGFGDETNDLELMDAAGLAVAMANGNDLIKSHADCICGSNNEEGIRIKLEEIFKSVL